MVKSGRSVYLESGLWVEIEKFRKDRGFNDVSSAVEYLLKKTLGEKK